MDKKRLEKLGLGNLFLALFYVTVIFALLWFIRLSINEGLKNVFRSHWASLLGIFFIEYIIFWTGIILVYIYSKQLGIKYRVIGLLTGLIPVVNFIVLGIIITITFQEYFFEKKKNRLNLSREKLEICKTKYPILFVHGVFFRDSKRFNYWGRIPSELEKNGATCFYGEHQSASSVKESAIELANRIRKIVEVYGCEKVNVIAHSKGGLDIKYAIAKLGMNEYIASLTTINTPHKGCEFADYLLTNAPVPLKNRIAASYNTALKKLGDHEPSFIDSVTDLTAAGCKAISDEIDNYDFKANGVYTQSVGSVMKKATSGTFPLNVSYHLVKHFDGRNDGLVGENSFKFGEKYIFIENQQSKRGISHGDMIDLCRENIKGFDVREFYVQLVADLKNRGL